MKNDKRKWTKNNWSVVYLFIIVVLLVVMGSLAAYTSFNSAKRVVSTGGTNTSTKFSSNYLTLADKNETSYAAKRITPTEVKSGDIVTAYTFTVQVRNYIYGNEEAYNLNNINYTFKVQLVANSGSALPEGINGVTVNGGSLDNAGKLEIPNQSLKGNQANTNSYQFSVPKGLETQMKFEIAAEPEEASYNATNGQKLAAVISLSSLTPTQNWTGKFLDDKNQPIKDYDAFNYEISGNGKGTVTLSWPDYLQISSWFLSDLGITVTENRCTIPVGTKEDSPTSYQFQFYRNPDVPISAQNWEALEEAVKVSFKAE